MTDAKHPEHTNDYTGLIDLIVRGEVPKITHPDPVEFVEVLEHDRLLISVMAWHFGISEWEFVKILAGPYTSKTDVMLNNVFQAVWGLRENIRHTYNLKQYDLGREAPEDET